MTREEKRAAIERYCNNTTCAECPLHVTTGIRNCYTADDDPERDADIERNYGILFGRERGEPERGGLEPPIRLDRLLRNPVKVMPNPAADDSGPAWGIDISLHVDLGELDAVIEKARELTELLESADRILDRVGLKMGAARNPEN